MGARSMNNRLTPANGADVIWPVIGCGLTEGDRNVLRTRNLIVGDRDRPSGRAGGGEFLFVGGVARFSVRSLKVSEA